MCLVFDDMSVFSEELSKYLVMVKKLQYEEEPDYNKLRDLFRSGLKKIGWKDEWKIGLPLSGPRSSPKVKKII